MIHRRGVAILGPVSKTWRIVLFVVLAGCGGKAGGSTEGPPKGPPETCSTSGGVWSCATDDAGITQDGGAPFFLSQCPSGVGSGVCMDTDQTVDTGNPAQPAHISHGDCLQCASNGLGIFWSCVSGSWQSQGVYSCQ